jgi:hypothetical protein
MIAKVRRASISLARFDMGLPEKSADYTPWRETDKSIGYPRNPVTVSLSAGAAGGEALR